MMLEPRNTSIDILKGLGIVSMVAGHVPVNQFLVHLIYVFHMPLFFFISGYLYRDKELSFKMLLEKNSKKLLFPYIFFGICGYVLWLLEMKPSLLNDALKPLKALFWMNTENMPIAGALWFLTAMFFLNLAYPFLFKCGILVQGAIVSFCLIVGLFLYQGLGIRLPFALDVAFVGLFFFHVGNRYKKYEQIICGINYFVIAFLFVCGVLGGMLNSKISMRTCDYGNSIIFLSCAVVIIVGLFRFVFWFNSAVKCRVKEYVAKIGEISIVFLCLNEIVINIMKSLFGKLLIDGPIAKWCVFFCSMVLIYFFAIVVKKKFKFIIGK